MLIDILGSSTHDLHVRRWGDGRPHRRLSEWPLVFQTYEQFLKRLRREGDGDLGYWYGLPQDLGLLQTAIWMTGGLAYPPGATDHQPAEMRVHGEGDLFARFGEEKLMLWAHRQAIEIDDEETEPTLHGAFSAAKALMPETVDNGLGFHAAMAFCPWQLDEERSGDVDDWVEEHRERDARLMDDLFDVGLRVDIAPQGLQRYQLNYEGTLYPGMTVLVGFVSAP